MTDTARALPSATTPLYCATIASAAESVSSSISMVTSMAEGEEVSRAFVIGAGANAC